MSKVVFGLFLRRILVISSITFPSYSPILYYQINREDTQFLRVSVAGVMARIVSFWTY